MAPKCAHLHQSSAGSNNSCAQITCTDCKDTLYKNYFLKVDRELFKRVYGRLESRMASGVKDEMDQAQELLETVLNNPDGTAEQEHLIDALNRYITRSRTPLENNRKSQGGRPKRTPTRLYEVAARASSPDSSEHSMPMGRPPSGFQEPSKAP